MGKQKKIDPIDMVSELAVEIRKMYASNMAASELCHRVDRKTNNKLKKIYQILSSVKSELDDLVAENYPDRPHECSFPFYKDEDARNFRKYAKTQNNS